MKYINHLLTNDSKILKNNIEKNKKNLITLSMSNEDILFKFYEKFKNVYKNINKSKFSILSKSNHILKKRKTLKKEKILKLNFMVNNLNKNYSNSNNSKKRSIVKNKIEKPSIFLKILKNLPIEIKNKIYTMNNFNVDKIKKVNNFIENIDNMDMEECVEWINYHGIDLLRSIYILSVNNQLPQEVNEILKVRDIDTISQFTSLDLQDNMHFNLPFTKKFIIKNKNIGTVIQGKHNINKILNLSIHNSEKIGNIPNKIFKYCLVLDFFTENNREIINIDLWLSDLKKLRPIKKRVPKYIGSREVNSGLTSYNSYSTHVKLWRKEEILKVLLHELIHSLSLESHNNDNIKKFIVENFDFHHTNNSNPFEAYVEFWAEIINILIIMVNSDKDLKNTKKKTSIKQNITKNIKKKDFLKRFTELLNIEINFTAFQCAKILKYFGYKKFEEFCFYNIKKNSSNERKFIQKSNVFSYFFLLLIYQLSFNDFIKLCFEKNCNVNNTNRLDNIKDIIKQKFSDIDLLSLIKTEIEKNNIGKVINYYINLKTIKDIKKIKNPKSLFINNTFRMSCLEMSLK